MTRLLSRSPIFSLINSRPKWVIIVFSLVFLWITTLTVPARAQYPQPTNSFINDYAGVLSSQDASAIQSSLQNLKNQTGVEMVLVTIGSLRDYGTGDNSIESFATNLFNNWGVGGASRNNGVMVLFDRDEKQVRVELGGAYSRRDDEVMRQIIDQDMLPYFRNNQYSQGLYRGVNAVINSVAPQSGVSTYGSSQVSPTTSTTYGPADVQPKKSGLSFGKIILIIIGVFIIYRILRSRARRNGSVGRGPFSGGSSSGRGSTGSFDVKPTKNGGFFGGGSSKNNSGDISRGGNYFGGGSSNNESSNSQKSSSSSAKGSSGGGGGSGSW